MVDENGAWARQSEAFKAGYGNSAQRTTNRKIAAHLKNPGGLKRLAAVP